MPTAKGAAAPIPAAEGWRRYAAALEALVAAQDALLVAYRVGDARAGGRAADRVAAARDRLRRLAAGDADKLPRMEGDR